MELLAMDEKRSSLQIFVCVLLIFPVLLFAENLTVKPAKCFLQGNLRSVILNWRFHSEKLKEKHFDKDFVFFHDGMKLENEGGGATMVMPGNPYVDYELVIKKPGSYVGKVESINTTAHVYTVESETNTTSAARSGSDLNLTCVGGPEGTVILWEEDGVPVDKKYRENKDGSLTVLKIDLPDALRKFGCRMFFTIDDREEYKKNKSNVPEYKTAVVNTPVLVYNTSRHSESESQFILQVASWKDGATVCGQKNLSDFCEKLGANISKVKLDRDSNFTIFMNQKLLVMDHYKVPEAVKREEKEPKASDNLTTILVVVAALVVVIVLLVAVVVIRARKPKKLCWKKTSHDTSGSSHDGLNENKDTAERNTPCCPFCCFTKGAKDEERNSEGNTPCCPLCCFTKGAKDKERNSEENTPCSPFCCFTKGAKDIERNSEERQSMNPVTVGKEEGDKGDIQCPESI